MSVRLKISVRKEELEDSKYCGRTTTEQLFAPSPGKHCAIAKAICALFPTAFVSGNYIAFYNTETPDALEPAIAICKLPVEAVKFIHNFDILGPKDRVKMQPIDFEIDVPDEAIKLVGGVEEATEIISRSRTLELVQNE